MIILSMPSYIVITYVSVVIPETIVITTYVQLTELYIQLCISRTTAWLLSAPIKIVFIQSLSNLTHIRMCVASYLLVE